MIISTLALVSLAGAKGTGAAPGEALRGACYTAVAQPLQASGGKITPDVREAYLRWSESEVTRELIAQDEEVSSAVLTEVRQNPVLREAVFGSVYPPDPSILQNYGRLRADLGEKFMERYRSLAVAISVAKRTKGVESQNELKSLGRDYQPEFWQDESLQIPGSEEDKSFVKALAGFMDENHVAAADLYQSQTLQTQLVGYLRDHHFSSDRITEVKTTSGFGERLKYAMVLLHQRPGSREPKPTTEEWLAHLVSIYESSPESTPVADGVQLKWPMFPADTAPWPLLMPLSHPVPISEANYIWEAFQGKHGEDRYHTYGPYRDDDAEMPYELTPSRWHWDAWPDRIQHGGECVPISKGTVDLYSSLVKPAMWAGQPGHANLVSFQSVGGYWLAEVEQAFAGGPDVTFAQWYFDEEPGSELRHRDLYYWAGAEYQLGLALAMDVGLDSYLDTRLATIIYKAMPDNETATLGVSLLRSAIQENPFNPEAWYRLAQATTDPSGSEQLVKAAMNLGNQASLGQLTTGQRPKKLADCLKQYTETLSQFLAHFALLDKVPPDAEAQRREVYQFLKSVPGVHPEDLATYSETFAGADTENGKLDDLGLDQALAGKSDGYGLLRMGERYREGDGVDRNPAKAEEMFLAAIRQNETAAGIEVANCYPWLQADGIRVTASSAFGPDQSPQHLVDGSGLTGILHDNDGAAGTMWHTAEHPSASSPAPELPSSPAWVRFDFPGGARFDTILIWNHNQHGLTDRGFHTARIYGTTDGKNWVKLTAGDSIVLPKAGGEGSSGPIKIRNSSPGSSFSSVVISSDSNYGGTCYGLSAVKFSIYSPDPLIPASQITVSASSHGHDQLPEHLIDGSGMVGPYHDNNQFAFSMWHTAPQLELSSPVNGMPPSPAWVRFDFKKPEKLEEVQVWNINQPGLSMRGFNKTRIYGTTDGSTWFPVTNTETVQLPPATGAPFLESVSVPIYSGDKLIKAVIIAADSAEGNRGGDCYGLSAVKFLPRY